jgi:aminopeptidase N
MGTPTRRPACPADVDALPELDRASGAMHQGTCLAMRPDPAAKERAWTAVISGAVTGRLAEATARGLWVAGQEELMDGYRSRYFGEALPALAAMSGWAQERLGRLLFPSTLCDAATTAAAQAALASACLPKDLQHAVAEQTAILAQVIACRVSPAGTSS